MSASTTIYRHVRVEWHRYTTTTKNALSAKNKPQDPEPEAMQ